MTCPNKTALPFGEAFFKGVLCNLLVCLAVWMPWPVTLGNIAGGSIMVAAVYHLIYGRALERGSWRP